MFDEEKMDPGKVEDAQGVLFQSGRDDVELMVANIGTDFKNILQQTLRSTTVVMEVSLLSTGFK